MGKSKIYGGRIAELRQIIANNNNQFNDNTEVINSKLMIKSELEALERSIMANMTAVQVSSEFSKSIPSTNVARESTVKQISEEFSYAFRDEMIDEVQKMIQRYASEIDDFSVTNNNLTLSNSWCHVEIARLEKMDE